MATVAHGTVTVSFADHLTPPERAGKLSFEDVRRIPKAPRGIGLACDQGADAMVKAGTRFIPPADLTPDNLRAAGTRAEEIGQVILDLEVMLVTLKQANVLFDADAWEKLRMLNEQIKAQGKFNPELLNIFKAVLEFFARNPSRPAAAKKEG